MNPTGPDSARLASGQGEARRMMVTRLTASGIVRDPRLAQALERIPRHVFVPEALTGQAYLDHALPIGEGQTITQPANVARAIELAGLRPEARVLEVGTGSGYEAAVLSCLCGHVFSLERVPSLAAAAIRTIASLGIKNVSVKVFDGTYGWSDHAPYDAIIVAASAPEVPQPLVAQLKPGGRLVVPVGTATRQRLVVVRRLPSGRTRTEDGGEVCYVPLVGKFGWERPAGEGGRGR